jgi:hypothetical protein
MRGRILLGAVGASAIVGVALCTTTCRLGVLPAEAAYREPKPFVTVGTQSSYEFKQAAPWVHYGTATGVNAVGFADFNGDGNYDYVLGLSSNSTSSVPLQMYLGNSSGNFSQATSLLAGSPATVHARKVIVGDFNGDHVPDFFVADHGYDAPPFPGATPVLVLSGGGKFTQAATPGVSKGFQHGASSADVRGAGKLDIVLLDSTNGAYYLTNDGLGSFTAGWGNLPASITTPGANYFTVELIDVDGDGYFDLVVGGHEQDGFPTKVFWGDGSGTFSDSRSVTVPGDPDYPVVLDFLAEDTDGDGVKELVINRTKANPFYEGYYFQILMQANRQFTDASYRIAPSKSNWMGSNAHWVDWIQLVDANQDGVLDLRVMDRSFELVFLNDGHGDFSVWQ